MHNPLSIVTVCMLMVIKQFMLGWKYSESMAIQAYVRDGSFLLPVSGSVDARWYAYE